MSAASRLLLVGGIGLALLGMAYGLGYAALAEHQALDTIGASLTNGFTAAANRSPDSSHASLEHYRQAKYNYDRQVDVHGHWIGLATLLVVLSIGFDRIAFSERRKRLLAQGLLLGSFLFPLGVLLETYGHGALPQAVAVLGSALVMTALAGVTLGFIRRERPASHAAI
ncbi:MAG: hypothetical protein WA738_01510 [Candidatus Angelobacter sp.]